MTNFILLSVRFSRAGKLPVILAILFLSAVAAFGVEEHNDFQRARELVSAMKNSSRGPFERIRWFCKDGTIQPSPGRGCAGHGGGKQHGLLTKEVQELRRAGFSIGTIYADFNESDYTKIELDPFSLTPLLLERFLIQYDDGWVLRKARSYRGALQEEDERLGAQGLLHRILKSQGWRASHFLLLREASRLLPGTKVPDRLAAVRSQASHLTRSYGHFRSIRDKIHTIPGPEDARQVRDFARQHVAVKNQYQFITLAEAIDQLYQPASVAKLVSRLEYVGALAQQEVVKTLVDSFASTESGCSKVEGLSQLLLHIRDYFENSNSSTYERQLLLEISNELEQHVFSVARSCLAEIKTRAEYISFTRSVLTALYGVGFVSRREYRSAQASLSTLRASSVEAGSYRDRLEHVSYVAMWSEARLRFYFGDAIDKLSQVESLAGMYIPDRLRGSPLAAFAEAVEALMLDANRQIGLRHQFFGQEVGSGLRALNSGLARGLLVEKGSLQASKIPPEEAIYLVAATEPELPPVAGVLTENAGNPLSHVQLLARNLGVPNVVVTPQLLPLLRRYLNQRVVVAVSPMGQVIISRDSRAWDPILGTTRDMREAVITAEESELDLNSRELVSLQELRAFDSGRTVGPKAAKLAELKYHFSKYVPNALVLPFGIFRDALNLPVNKQGVKLFEYMRTEYANAASISDRIERNHHLNELRKVVQRNLLRLNFSRSFRTLLFDRLQAEFGPSGSYGVFVRSDTNVEDLPNFTGAGLNLTVPNVIGTEALERAIVEVWASPFAKRAFLWRQGVMTNPEQVYAAVLLMQSIPCDLSGVMVDVDLNSGSDNYLTVAANRGIGGVVNGQAAETLRIDRRTGDVRLYASATARSKQVLATGGGVQTKSISGIDRILSETQLLALYRFAEELDDKRDYFVDSGEAHSPLEVEFGFVGDRLVLFQVRPLVENTNEHSNTFWSKVALGNQLHMERTVDLGLVVVDGSI